MYVSRVIGQFHFITSEWRCRCSVSEFTSSHPTFAHMYACTNGLVANSSLTVFSTITPRGTIAIIGNTLVYQSGPQPPMPSSSSTGGVDPSSSTGSQSNTTSSTGSVNPSSSTGGHGNWTSSTGSVEPSSTGSSGNTTVSSSTGSVFPSSSSTGSGNIGWTYSLKQNLPYSFGYFPFLNLVQPLQIIALYCSYLIYAVFAVTMIVEL